MAFSSNDVPTDIEKVDLKLKQDQVAMTFLDLTSGEALLIQHGNGQTILVNTGGPNTQLELQRHLKLYDIKAIDTLIVTKNDPEYNSNTEWLSTNYMIGEIITSQNYPTTFEGRHEKWKTGQKVELLPGLNTHVIQGNENTQSIGMDLLFTFHNNQVLYMTSADIEIENALLEKLDLSTVNILKVADFAHNGGTSEPFVEHIDPQVAIIFQKRGVHSSQDVIERLQETWIDIYLTKQFGNITIKFNNEDYEIITISVESSSHIQVEML